MFKEGNQVFVKDSSFRGSSLSMAVIIKIGKIHITAKNGEHVHKYRVDSLERIGRGTGRMHMGDSSYYLVEITPETRAQYNLQLKVAKCECIVTWLNTIKMRGVSPDMLEKYYEILIQFEKKEP